MQPDLTAISIKRTDEAVGTAIPNRDTELKSVGAGPVTTYYLSEEELNRMREKDAPACGLTRQDLLGAIAAGETLSSIERAWGMKYNTIHNWVKKWGLKGITPDRAQELLEQNSGASESPAGPAPVTVEEVASRIIAAEAEWVKEKNAEIERLRRELANSNDEILVLQTDLGKACDMIADLNTQLEDARPVSHESDEPVGIVVEKNDSMVDHPAHYNAGPIECIDAIEAATTGLSGVHAFNTGTAIKYLWRWSHKGGVEDLQKARWYIDRLIAAAGGA